MKKIYIVPNLVTTGNMLCGFYSVIESIRGNFVLAAWIIILGQIFDLLDGRIARFAKATSSFGVEYDSLSDVITFGMAPAFLIYLSSMKDFGRLGWIISFLFVACGAIRLARFNVSADEEVPDNYFQGLPTPAGAACVATFTIFKNDIGIPTFDGLTYVMGAIAIVIPILMVSSIPFPSFKKLNWASRATYGYFVVAVVSLVTVILRPEVALFGIVMLYILSGLVWNVYRTLKGDRITFPQSTVFDSGEESESKK